MTLSRTIQALLTKWHITIAGVLLSVAAAGLTFTFVPAQYASTSTAVLVQPKLPGTTSANPLLSFNASLNTTAMILVQSLNSPEVATSLALTWGRDSFTVKNAASASIGGGIEQPFISVSAQSPNPQKSAEIVAAVMNLAQQELADRQNGLHVFKSSAIMLQTVVDVTPPKPVQLAGLATAGAVLLLGVVITILVACACDRRTARRVPLDDDGFGLRSGDISGHPVAVAWSAATAMNGTNRGNETSSGESGALLSPPPTR
jgi:capsular polysaccharide biosynthesis protein